MAHRPNGHYGRYPPPPYPPPDVAYPESDVSPYYRPPPQMWPQPAYPSYPRPPPGYGYEGGPPHGFYGAPPQHWQNSRRGNTAGRPKPPTPLKVPGPGETIKTPPLANSATPTAPDRRPSSLGSADNASQSGRANESSAPRASGGPGNAQENAAEPPVAVQTSSNAAPTPPSPVDVHAQSYAGLKRENASLQAQLDAMKANMNELKETWDVARNLLASEKNRFKSQSGDAQKEIAELKAKIKTLEAQSGVAALRKQVEDLSEKCLDLEVQNRGLLDHLASIEEPQPEEEANRKELREVEVQTEKKEEQDYSMQTPASQLATVETQTDSNVPSETPEVPTPEPPTAAKKHSEASANTPPTAAKKHSEVTTPEPPTAVEKLSEVPTPEPLTTPKKPSEAPADVSPNKKPSRGQKRAPATNAHADGVTHLGHHYHYGNQRGRRGKDPCVFWDCDRQGCPARAYTSRETGEVVRTMGKHNHPPPSATETESGGKAEGADRPPTAEDLRRESNQASTPVVGSSGMDHRSPRAKRTRRLTEEVLNSSTGSETDARSGSRTSQATAEPHAGGGDDSVALLQHPYTSDAQVSIPLGAFSERRVRAMFELIVNRRAMGEADAHIESRLREVAAGSNKDDVAVSLFQHVLPFVPKA